MNSSQKPSFKRCPFCGGVPEPFGSRLDNDKNVVAQIIHPIIKECPLNQLVFSIDSWENRHEGREQVKDRHFENALKEITLESFQEVFLEGEDFTAEQKVVLIKRLITIMHEVLTTVKKESK